MCNNCKTGGKVWRGKVKREEKDAYNFLFPCPASFWLTFQVEETTQWKGGENEREGDGTTKWQSKHYDKKTNWNYNQLAKREYRKSHSFSLQGFSFLSIRSFI